MRRGATDRYEMVIAFVEVVRQFIRLGLPITPAEQSADTAFSDHLHAMHVVRKDHEQSGWYGTIFGLPGIS